MNALLLAATLVAHFTTTEQSLMDAVASGDKAVWERTLDDSAILTSEEGMVMTKKELVDSIAPLPKGLRGEIKVRDLTVQEFPDFAIVRFLADESEDVFATRIFVKYRITDTFRKVGKEWKLVASHTSVITADPPAQNVATDTWPGLVGKYQLAGENAWIFHVEMRDGKLFGGRNPDKLRPLVPLAPDVFVVSGALGEYFFVMGKDGKAERIVNLRKFAPLVWTRVE
jgi:hypothetical protein